MAKGSTLHKLVPPVKCAILSGKQEQSVSICTACGAHTDAGLKQGALHDYSLVASYPGDDRSQVAGLPPVTQGSSHVGIQLPCMLHWRRDSLLQGVHGQQHPVQACCALRVIVAGFCGACAQLVYCVHGGAGTATRARTGVKLMTQYVTLPGDVITSAIAQPCL